MGTILCALCRKTAVYKAGDRCSTCRYQVRHPETVPAGPEARPVAAAEAIDTADLLANTKQMAADQIQRLQDALGGNGLFQGDTLNEMNKLVRVLQVVVELELALRKAARGKVYTNDEKIDHTVGWAASLSKAKRDRLVQLLTEAG